MFKILPNLVLLVLCYSFFLACGDLNNGFGGGGVSGTVFDQYFSDSVGTAEKVASTYTLTMANTPEFSCNSITPAPSSYLLIDIPDIVDQPGEQTFSAAGRVFFNKLEDDFADSSGATSGSVTIESIDAFNVNGIISASGPDGDISGSFSVEICN